MSRKKTLLSKEAKAAIADAKAAQKRAKQIYKAQIKEMRPFLNKLKDIDLRRDITAGQKSFVTKAWKEYTELTTRPFKVYRTKSAGKLKKAQAIGRHEKGAVNFDVAFVPTADPNAKLSFKGDQVFVTSKHVTETYLFFDLARLARDPEKEIAATLNRAPKAKQFVVMAGKYLWNGGLAREKVADKVQQLMAHYNNPEANNYFQNWLFGIVAADYHDQKLVDEYRREYHRQKEQRKLAKQNTRRKRQRAYGKKF